MIKDDTIISVKKSSNERQVSITNKYKYLNKLYILHIYVFLLDKK